MSNPIEEAGPGNFGKHTTHIRRKPNLTLLFFQSQMTRISRERHTFQGYFENTMNQRINHYLLGYMTTQPHNNHKQSVKVLVDYGNKMIQNLLQGKEKLKP